MMGSERNGEASAQKDPGCAVLNAFRFLEDVGSQVEALRKVLIAKVQESGKLGDNMKTCVFEEDDEYDSSSWLFRSTIDTFDIRRSGKKGKAVPIFYAAFKISLAPSQPANDGHFFPYVAVLLLGMKNHNDWDKWTIDEFDLDEQILSENGWIRSQEDDKHFEDVKPLVGAISKAFIVPLVALKNEKDVANSVIEPLASYIGVIAKKLKI